MFCKFIENTTDHYIIVSRGRVYKGLVGGEEYIGQILPSELGGWDSCLNETIDHAYIILKGYKNSNRSAEWKYIIGNEILTSKY